METNELMRQCQRGFGNYKGALDDANNLLAECYGHIGMLHSQLERIDDAVRRNDWNKALEECLHSRERFLES